MPLVARAEIVRRFRDREKEPTSALVRQQLGRFRAAGDQTWTSILPRPATTPTINGVILEAGSGTGKSTEVEAQAERLRTDGVAAFFCAAKRVASAGLVAALGKELEAFRRWQASAATGVLFVDAVDEVYLEHRSSTDLFRELEREIDFVVADVVLVMTTRTGTWGDHEATLLRKSLGMRDRRATAAPQKRRRKPRNGTPETAHAAAQQPWEPTIEHVTFEPLDGGDVRRLAAFYGAADAEKFSKAFDENEVADFMDARPRDVQLFVQYWNLHHHLGSWTDVAAWFVNWTYPELNAERRHRALSLVEYADGLKRVAAASIMTKQPHIVLPTAPSLPGANHACELFPDWPPAKLAELFGSPLFVPKTESAVQLPQGAVTQCLAALWFASRYRVDRDLDAIVGSIFTAVPGTTGLHLPDSRRPVAGWLATTLVDFRKPLRAVAPDVLLHFGDPAKLDAHEIGSAIRQLVARRAIRHWEWPSQATLARLARPELEETLLELVKDEYDPDMLWHLFRFVEAGKYVKCVPRARELALDETRAGQAHGLVVRVVRKLGTVTDRRALRGLLNTKRLETKAALVATLTPDLLTGDELAALLVSGCNHSIASTFATKCADLPLHQLNTILRAIDRKTANVPRRAGRRLSAHFNDESESSLIHAACSAMIQCLARQLPQRLPRFLQRLPVTVQIVGEHDYVDREIVSELNEALQRSVRVRRGVWAEKLKVLRRDRHLHDHSGNTVAPLLADDFDWLYLESERPANKDIRAGVSYILTGAYLKLDAAQRSAVRVQASAGLIELFNDTDAQQEAAEKATKRRLVRDARSAAAQRKKNGAAVRPRLDSIRDGSHTNSLLWAWQQMRSSHTERARVTTAGLAELVGTDLAEDFLTGFAAMWRKHAVTVPVAGSNSVSWTTLMALTGVTVEYQRGLDFASLDENDAKTAALLAMHELNGFPPWMGELVGAQREAVRASLFETIAGEWDCAQENHGVLRFAAYESKELGALMKSIVFDLAAQRAPAHFKTVHHAASAILTSSDEPGQGAALAATMTASSSSQADACAEWLRLWAHTRPTDAAAWIASLPSPSRKSQHDLTLRLAALLGQDFDRDGGKVASDFLSPLAVRAWMPLLVEVVRPAQDISHEGAHVVGDRDNAQELRNKCLSALTQDGSPESHGVLKQLYRQSTGTAYAATLASALSAHEKRAAEKAAEPWTVEGILDFDRGRLPAPTSMAGLFDLVRRHLRQVGESQELGDFSHRELFAPRQRSEGQKARRVELSVQRWVAATLQLVARGVYSVERETETQDENSVDICARIPGIGRLPIEIKPIGRYSEKELRETIELQLLAKYMRPREVSHGVLLLVQLSDKVHKVGRNRRASYAALCKALSDFALGFAVSDGKTISVDSISLVQPRKAPAPRRRPKRPKPTKRRARS